MTLNIEFTPQEEAWLNAQALRQGLPPAEIIKKMIDEKLTPETERTETAALEAAVSPNEGMLAALRGIAERQQGRRKTDGSDTLRLIREARAGAMYGYDPAE
jgi:hypothetical protein